MDTQNIFGVSPSLPPPSTNLLLGDPSHRRLRLSGSSGSIQLSLLREFFCKSDLTDFTRFRRFWTSSFFKSVWYIAHEYLCFFKPSRVFVFSSRKVKKKIAWALDYIHARASNVYMFEWSIQCSSSWAFTRRILSAWSSVFILYRWDLIDSTRPRLSITLHHIYDTSDLRCALTPLPIARLQPTRN